ncbi:MAG: ABC-2 family transporter protein [Bacteriovoracaceae bacterium]|nr:ABC-2 family transporter protein [Bacteriovoracaceae bacterium]
MFGTFEKKIFGIEWQKILSYRFEFWLNFFGEMALCIIIPYFLWDTIYVSKNITVYHGLALPDIVSYSFCAFYCFKIVMGGGKEGSISQEIYYGTLSRYLVYPMNYLFMKYIQYMATSLFHLSKFVLLLVLAKWWWHLPIDPTVEQLGLFVLILFLAANFVFLIFTINECMAFWADNVWSLQVIFRTTLQILGGLYSPLLFFPEKFQNILAWSPISHCVYTPVMILLGKQGYPLFSIFASLMISISILFFLLKAVWKRGLIKFEAAGM